MLAVWSAVITLGITLTLLFLAYNLSLVVPVASPPGEIGSSISATPSTTPADKTWCEVDSQLATCPSPISGYMRDCEWVPELARYKDCNVRERFDKVWCKVAGELEACAVPTD